MEITTPQQRQETIQVAIFERMARGMNYSEAFTLVMSLPEFQSMFAEEEKPEEVASLGYSPARMADVNIEVERLMKELECDYNTAWEKVRRDPNFSDVFNKSAASLYRTIPD